MLGVLALVGGVLADVFAARFWAHHSLLAGLASSLIVVLLTLALLNEGVALRQRQRWSVLAQYVMLVLVRQARLVWMGLAEMAGLMPEQGIGRLRLGNLVSECSTPEGAQDVRDTPRLSAAILELLTDDPRRQRLQAKIDRLAERQGDVLARWAAVMLASDLYAEVIDRHVEVASDLERISGRLGDHGAIENLVLDLVAVIQQTEELDQATLRLALQIVPLGWWRSGRTPPRSPASA